MFLLTSLLLFGGLGSRLAKVLGLRVASLTG